MKEYQLPDKIKQQLAARKASKNENILRSSEKPEVVILSSPSDIGVIRNGGRQGAYLAPKVIINEFKKYESSSHSIRSILHQEVTSLALETLDYEKAQKEQSEKIFQTFIANPLKPTIHLGGGHDHIFPLLVALSMAYPKKTLNIINLDAHLDTRKDSSHHSGTPFRKFDQVTDRHFILNQIAIQNESNSLENFSNLNNGEMKIYPVQDVICRRSDYLSDLLLECINANSDFLNIMSVDLDVCDGSDFRSCSAVNPCGLKNSQLDELLMLYKNSIKHNGIYGFYEYNPLYDDQANSDGKKVAWRINQIIKKKPNDKSSGFIKETKLII